MARLLVTGGAGFLGSHLCGRLVELGHQVVCADNFSTGSRDNIRQLLAVPAFELIEHDVTLPLDLDVDGIYHLASPAAPIHYQNDPIRTTRTNVLGAINMLDLARSRGARILQASTSEIYGDPEVHPQPETYWGRVNPIGTRSCYNEGKRCAETLFFDYWREARTEIKVARIFNTYGPNMHPDDGRVVSNFVVQAIRGEPLTIYGTGGQTRSFCYVDDLVDGLLRLMASPADFTGPANIGNPHEVTMIELAEHVLRLVGGGSKLEFRPLPADDPRQRCPDISLMRAALGWRPRISLEDGLRQTVAYFQRRLATA